MAYQITLPLDACGRESRATAAFPAHQCCQFWHSTRRYVPTKKDTQKVYGLKHITTHRNTQCLQPKIPDTLLTHVVTYRSGVASLLRHTPNSSSESAILVAGARAWRATPLLVRISAQQSQIHLMPYGHALPALPDNLSTELRRTLIFFLVISGVRSAP